ncbi:putative 39S ribosomal protein L4 mitochondrial [Scophthalmus maximus]|uniref:Large ribosomal subunit protein uL4m n=1 Tax=Scophthalmus maximus TaxID=52904 RepID=A0A2U9BMW2_SCOMX|nr:putative 39S ribosomal protein L4 mitochondrial [Scophthalmus maximus]
MLRVSLLLRSGGAARRFSSSFSGASVLPPNLLLPSNLVDPARLKRPPPPADCPLPLLRKCDAAVPSHLSPVQTWVETLQRPDGEPLGLAQLHPDVFAVRPRLDILHDVESIRSPIWRGGGVSHGPRGPTSYYYMLPLKVRVQGLKVALSSKMAQDFLHIVDSLNIPTPDPQYLLDLVRHRHWGDSVLIVHVGDEFPENLLQATENLKTVNVIPAIGLNVHSMLKHEVVVLTLDTVKFLEDKLLWHDQRYTPLYPFKLPYADFP